MKKFFVLLICMAMCLSRAAALAEEEQRETLTCGDYEYAVLADGTAEITGYTGEAEALEVPAELDGKPVTSIVAAAIRIKGSISLMALR